MGLKSWFRSLVSPESAAPDSRRVSKSGSSSRFDARGGLPAPPGFATDTPDHYRLDVPKVPASKRGRGRLDHLGDGVSFDLSRHTGDAERLGSLGLPVIQTPNDLASHFGITPARLKWLAFHNASDDSNHYIHFSIPKKSGGTRAISVPRPQIAACQRRILDEILRPIPVGQAAHGFVTGRSIVTGAREHVGQDCVVNMDLNDFFPTITLPRVAGLFRSFGYSPAVAKTMALICTSCPPKAIADDDDQDAAAVGNAAIARSLPQGACTSPAISNLVCRSLDRRLAGLTEKTGWRYSRYADDMTFSASGEAAGQVGYLIHRIHGITHDERFVMHDKKTRVVRRGQCQKVTGLVVNDRVGVDRKTVRRLRSILHHAKTEGLESQNRDGHPDFPAWIAGMIGHVMAVDPVRGRAMRDQLVALMGSSRE